MLSTWNKFSNLPQSNYLIVDVEGLTTDITWDKELPLYFIGIIEVGYNKPKIHRFFREGINQAISFIQQKLNEGWQVVCHNAKFDYSVLKTRGLQWDIKPGYLSFMCTQQMAYFMDTSKPNSLDALTGQKDDIIEACKEYLPEGTDKKTFWSTDWSDNLEVIKLIADYCIQDCKATHSLYKRLSSWYNKEDKRKYIATLAYLEFPMIEVLSHMLLHGSFCNLDEVQKLEDTLHSELQHNRQLLSSSVYKLPKLTAIDDYFEPKEVTYKRGYYKNIKTNIRYYLEPDGSVIASDFSVVYPHCELADFSPSAASGHIWWLINKSNPKLLSTAKKTKKGKVQLDGDFLDSIIEELPEEYTFVKIAKAEKALSKCSELRRYVSHDGRIHGNYNHCLTRTGRLSSSYPNLQNIPRADGNPDSTASRFRKLFTASNRDNVILVADIDRIEICVLAWFLWELEHDDSLLLVCNEPGSDVHQANADAWGVTRSQAKTIQFAVVYGATAMRLHASGLGNSEKEAQRILDSAMNSRPSIPRLKERIWKVTRERGYVSNPFGAIGVYPECNSKQEWIRSRGERQAFNFLIQRTSRDILNMLLLESLPTIQKHNAVLCNVVHDEAVVECLREVASNLQDSLNTIWSNRTDILPGIRINGDWSQGNSWYEAK
jgi:DNA polymerase I-like protein with 3'-5' exonuclease and polymerase domains